MVLVDIITKCPGEVNPGDLLPSDPGLVHQGLAGSEDGCLAHDQGFDIILRDDDILSYRSLLLPGNDEFGYLAALPDPFMGDGGIDPSGPIDDTGSEQLGEEIDQP